MSAVRPLRNTILSKLSTFFFMTAISGAGKRVGYLIAMFQSFCLELSLISQLRPHLIACFARESGWPDTIAKKDCSSVLVR